MGRLSYIGVTDVDDSKSCCWRVCMVLCVVKVSMNDINIYDII